MQSQPSTCFLFVHHREAQVQMKTVDPDTSNRIRFLMPGNMNFVLFNEDGEEGVRILATRCIVMVAITSQCIKKWLQRIESILLFK